MNVINEHQPTTDNKQQKTINTQAPILFISVGILAICGIFYELIISTFTAYFLGNSILHFSLTIGLFLFFMGVGAYISRFFTDKFLLDYFIQLEILLGIIGGLTGGALYVAYATTESYYLVAFILVGLVGSLVGLEIPLLTRIIHQQSFELRHTLAQVLSFDYLGALVASLVFPLFMLPYLGLLRTSFVVGLLNLSVGIFNIYAFKEQLQNFRLQLGVALSAISLYIFGFAYSFSISGYLEQLLYQDEIVVSQQTPYQRIVVTQWKEDVRLFLNENLQFCSIDEHRYHETLVHVPLGLHPNPEKVLILGGGDGLAVREVLKHEKVQQIDLVDLDKAITDLASQNTVLRKLNQNALKSNKLRVFNEDAFKFVERGGELYSVIIIDLPDPNEVSLGKLYSEEFYKLVGKILAKDGIIISQSSSPYFARKVFWCIGETMKQVFPHNLPITLHVPSFGQWGFQIASRLPLEKAEPRLKNYLKALESAKKLRYLRANLWEGLKIFDPDMSQIKVEPNNLSTQYLIQYYEDSWKQLNE
jgi:spermidine synthase